MIQVHATNSAGEGTAACFSNESKTFGSGWNMLRAAYGQESLKGTND